MCDFAQKRKRIGDFDIFRISERFVEKACKNSKKERFFNRLRAKMAKLFRLKMKNKRLGPM